MSDPALTRDLLLKTTNEFVEALDRAGGAAGIPRERVIAAGLAAIELIIAAAAKGEVVGIGKRDQPPHTLITIGRVGLDVEASHNAAE